MRKVIGYALKTLVSLLVLSALLAFLATLGGGTDAPLAFILPVLIIAMSGKWPFLVLVLAYCSAPPESNEPPPNLQKHKDRILFSKVLLGVAAGLYLFDVCYMLGIAPRPW
jgi:hypothetical protein